MFGREALVELLLAPDQTSNAILARLQASPPAAKPSVKAANRQHDHCEKCHERGLRRSLKLCGESFHLETRRGPNPYSDAAKCRTVQCTILRGLDDVLRRTT